MDAIKHRQSHARGTRVSGAADGRVYLVHPRTGLLHLEMGGSFDPSPRLHPDDLAEFRQFPDVFEVVDGDAAEHARAEAEVNAALAGRKQLPPPPRSRASAGAGAEELRDPVAPMTPSPADLEAFGIPSDDDAHDTRGWLALAGGLVEMTLEERQTRPKKALVALIRVRASQTLAARMSGVRPALPKDPPPDGELSGEDLSP